ncbi:MAG: hypothetical protein JXQ23_02330, partial [Clostridia bacterium]|nr:hypothetical protein [Clostridia bacterium]
GGRTYLGKIIIDKMEVREEWKTQTVKINFDTDGMGVMYYLDKEDSNYSLVPHAYVSMGDMGSSIVLSLIDEGDVNTHMLANSTMIAGPADDRSEAVMLSNELMKKYLDNEIK